MHAFIGSLGSGKHAWYIQSKVQRYTNRSEERKRICMCIHIYIYVCVCTHTLCIYTHPYTKEFGKQELEEDIATGRERERASEREF